MVNFDVGARHWLKAGKKRLSGSLGFSMLKYQNDFSQKNLD